MTAAHPHLDIDPLADKHNPDHFKVGTLSYTKAGLITVFLYLLWGDFCFQLMETVVPSIMPIKLNDLGAPNWALGAILATLPNLMNTAINPFISFRSDRFRSKWGRRVPFLAGATPFLVIFLILLGYSEPISIWVQNAVLHGRGSQIYVLLGVISVLMIGFQFFNLFITSVFYYLFNDVVPRAFLARFMALFRMVGGISGSLYSFFIFKYAKTHMAEIFLGAALLYLVVFLLMCWKVKEGEYPPPPENLGHERGFFAAARTYATECFTHRFYWFFFIANTCVAMTWVSGSYGVLLNTKVIGLSLDTIGKVGGVTGLISTVLLYPAAMFADRYHPLRVLLIATIAQTILVPVGIAFAFTCHLLEPQTRLYVWIGLACLSLPIGTLYGAAELPTLMKLLPQERYGQFCSANAMIRSVALMVAGIACGVFLDLMKRYDPDPNQCFRFLGVWNLVFYLGSTLFLCLLYREWKKLGGLTGYQPPRPDLPDHDAMRPPPPPTTGK